MTVFSVKTFSQDVFDTFGTQKGHLLSRSIQVGLKYAMKGFIKYFKIIMAGNQINLEASV